MHASCFDWLPRYPITSLYVNTCLLIGKYFNHRPLNQSFTRLIHIDSFCTVNTSLFNLFIRINMALYEILLPLQVDKFVTFSRRSS